jgi:hypothetical protein
MISVAMALGAPSFAFFWREWVGMQADFRQAPGVGPENAHCASHSEPRLGREIPVAMPTFEG